MSLNVFFYVRMREVSHERTARTSGKSCQESVGGGSMDDDIYQQKI